jgi:predicted nucleic acid-binding protein
VLIVDTSVWVDLFAGRETVQVGLFREATGVQRVAVGDLMVCEILQGIRVQRQFDHVRSVLQDLMVVEMVGHANAVAAAANYRALRQRGITVRGTIDCLIATFCIEGGHRLLHNDRDFDPFERHLGLSVLRPTGAPS